MTPDETPKPSRFTRQQIELAAIVLGALAAACSIIQFIAWVVHG